MAETGQTVEFGMVTYALVRHNINVDDMLTWMSEGEWWCRFVMRIEMPSQVRVKLVEALADVE